MKKKILVYSLICSCFILACSRDSDDTSEPGTVDKKANLLGTGASANDFLANTNFDKLLIEIAYVDGFRPTAQTISNFETFLRETTFKTDIEFIYKSLPSPNDDTLELDEIVDLESENRTAYNNGKTLTLYIYFANSPSEGDDEDEGLVTLGAVYRNTSMVIYESTIRNLASRSVSISLTDVESATLNHEFGHLLGLVNLGTTPVNDHEDTTTNDEGNEEGNNHCNVTGCLMRAELQFGVANKNSRLTSKNGMHADCNLSGMSMMKLLQQQASKGLPIVPVLDAECILDLQNNGGR
ncbi:hypothetical protein [Flagellimonas onchidii]|uniref:hypothetical protein n=1 Tax=Flagellimonas onchidii TaxID=2562684 RepID=UPI0010A5F310|nr:hypothetical protein [Allomuricauda onchidii]